MGEVRGGKRAVAARILVVDDDEDLRYMLKLVLERQGFQVLEADCLAAAMAAPPVDLLITDLHLPDGSGEELVLRLRALRPQPAIALSGSKTSAEGAFDAHLQKPTGARELLDSVERVLGGAG